MSLCSVCTTIEGSFMLPGMTDGQQTRVTHSFLWWCSSQTSISLFCLFYHHRHGRGLLIFNKHGVFSCGYKLLEYYIFLSSSSSESDSIVCHMFSVLLISRGFCWLYTTLLLIEPPYYWLHNFVYYIHKIIWSKLLPPGRLGTWTIRIQTSGCYGYKEKNNNK